MVWHVTSVACLILLFTPSAAAYAASRWVVTIFAWQSQSGVDEISTGWLCSKVEGGKRKSPAATAGGEGRSPASLVPSDWLLG